MEGLYRSLSDKEITRRSGMPCYLYRELEERIELPSLPFCLLYEMAPNRGHWCLVHRTVDTNGAPCIEMFDSYGIFPDNELNWVTPDFKKVSGQQHTHLLRLLMNSEQNIAYNNVCLQGPKTSTCGRWCIFRQKNHKISAERFASEVKKNACDHDISMDEYVVLSVPDKVTLV
jgi:hypothetical protein